jgi:hypothetical protein
MDGDNWIDYNIFDGNTDTDSVVEVNLGNLKAKSIRIVAL